MASRPSKRLRTATISPGDDETSQLVQSINRAALDFDPPPICSVTLRSHNVYACLTCGRFFHGRSPDTPAHTHCLLESHRLFINLTTSHIYSLPEDEAFNHPSLKDVINALHPTFQPSDLSKLDTEFLNLRSRDSNLRIRGVVGLDSTHSSNAATVILQLALRPSIIRNTLLLHHSPYAHSLHPDTSTALYDSLSLICRKVWASHAFRPHIAPHSFMQIIAREASKHPTLSSKSDPVEILAWLLNSLTNRSKSNIVTPSPIVKSAKKFGKLIKKLFQGSMLLTTKFENSVATAAEDTQNPIEEKESSFWFLSLDLPSKPLFKNQTERDIVPQVTLEKLLQKFNGVSQVHVVETGAFKSYEITHSPPLLFLVVKRFSKSKFGNEKNPCVVHLPTDSLDVSKIWKLVHGKYRLIGTVSHDGSLEKGQFRVAIFHQASKTWYDVTDVSVEKTVFQLVALRDSYVLLYELVTGVVEEVK